MDNPILHTIIDMTILVTWLCFLSGSKDIAKRILWSTLIALTVFNLAVDAIKVNAAKATQTQSP